LLRELTYQILQLTQLKQVITASEIGVMTTLTDLARDSASRNVASDIGKLFGEAIAKKVDTDLAGLFSSFSSDIGLLELN
jgi:hypothetical protein